MGPELTDADVIDRLIIAQETALAAAQDAVPFEDVPHNMEAPECIAMRAAISAYHAILAERGFVVVPKEPSEEMVRIAAGYSDFTLNPAVHANFDDYNREFASAWRRMVEVSTGEYEKDKRRNRRAMISAAEEGGTASPTHPWGWATWFSSNINPEILQYSEENADKIERRKTVSEYRRIVTLYAAEEGK